MRTVIAAAAISCFSLTLFGQETPFEKANRLYNEGNDLITLQTNEGFTRAEDKYQEAISIFELVGDMTGAAKAYVGLGHVTDSLGRSAESLAHYEKALGLFTQLKNDYWAARTLNNMARIYDDSGQPLRALELFEKALPIRISVGDLNGQAVTLNGIGAVYAKLGEFRKALEFYDRALAVRNAPEAVDDGNNRRGKAITFNNIGRVYDELGDGTRALEYFNKSLPIRKAEGDRNGEATTLNNLGLVSLDLGKLDDALGFLNSALAIYRKLARPESEALVLGNIAVIHIEKRQPDLALANLSTALEIYRNYGDKSGEATILNNVAIAESQKGLDSGPLTLNKALLLSRQTGEKTLETITLSNLMTVWKDKENPAVAVFYGKQAVNNYQGIRKAISSLDDEVRRKYLASVTETYRVLAGLLIELGQFAQAKQVLNMLKAEEYFDFVRRDSQEIKNLANRVDLTEREKILIARYEEIAEKVTALSAEFAQLEGEKRKTLQTDAELSRQNQLRYSELSETLTVANSAFRLFIEKQLIDELGKNRVREIEYDRSLQARLRNWGSDTVAVYTVVTDDRYRVIMTTSAIQIDGKTDITEAALNKKVFEFRDALQDINADPREKGKELYDILLKPIEKELKASGATTIVWSLDGTLRYIPVSALSPDGKTYLIEHYQNAVITANTRNDIADKGPSARAIGFGVSKASTITNPLDPERMIEFSAIPGSVTELESIVRDESDPEETGLFLGKRYLDDEFTKTVFEESLATTAKDGKPKYSVVHLASHFRLGSNWSDSFLLLGNGKYLTLEQIGTSPTLNFGDVELVTLSACDTAFASDANGKEIDSLAEAILTKSGKAVLATLWAVVDESTPLLMTEFYRLQKQNPSMTKSEAIQKVQEGFVSGRIRPDEEYIERLAGAFAVRGASATNPPFEFDKKKPFAHPYFWSPFVLIGNWR